jgi:hypothetical protein
MSQDNDALERHRVVYEPPELITGFPTGTLTVEAARIIWKFVDESCAQTDRFYWISDISGLGRYAAGDLEEHATRAMRKLAGLAIVGGNFSQRTMMTVLIRAARLLGRVHKDSQVEFFPDETTARVWIDSLRKKHAETSR